MFDFEISESKQHASNVFSSFVSCIRAQFVICSERESTKEYKFSSTPIYPRGWSVAIEDESDHVIIKTQVILPDDLIRTFKMTPARKKAITPSHPTKFLPDEFGAMKKSMAGLIAKKYGFKKSEIIINIDSAGDDKTGFVFTINITEMTDAKLSFISNLLTASNFKPRATQKHNYKL